MPAVRKGPNTTDYPSGIQENTYANLVDVEITELWKRSACWLSGVAGTNVITATAAPTIEAYDQPMAFWLIPANANTGGVTINVDGVGAVAIKDASGNTLDGGDLTSGKLYLIVYDGTQFRLFETGGAAGNISSAPDAIFEEQQASGVDAGTFTTGAWRTRALNTSTRNALSGASLSSNEFTLQAGTYYIEWDAPAHDVALHKSRLYNVTDASVVAGGSSEQSGVTADVSNNSRGASVVTITSSKAFRIEHRCSSTSATTGFGRATSLDTEIYAVARVWKVGTLVAEVSGRHGGGIAITYDYRTGGGSPDDPGLGGLMFNDLNFEGSPTPDRLFLDAQSNDLTNWASALQTISGGQGRIVKEDDPTKWVVFTTLSRTDQSGYTEFVISIDDASETTPFVDGDSVLFMMGSPGAQGAPGATAATIIFQLAEPSTSQGTGSVWVKDNAELNLYELSGSPLEWVYTGKNLKGVDGTAAPEILSQGTSPSTNRQDGSLWIDTSSTNSDLYTLTGSPSEWVDTGIDMQAADGASIITQLAEPSTNYQDGSLWVKTNDELNLYELQGSPSEWVYTGKSLKGSAGKDGPQIFVQAGEPTTNIQDGSIWVKNNDELNVYLLTGSPSEWVYTGKNLKGVAGKDGAQIYVQNAAPSVNVQDGSLWIDQDSTRLDLYKLTGSPSEWVDTGKDLKGDAPQIFVQLAEPSVNLEDGSVWIKLNDQLNLYVLTGSPSEWVYSGKDLKGITGKDGAQLYMQAAEPTTNVQDGSLWVKDNAELNLYELQGSPSEWVYTGKNLKGATGKDAPSIFVQAAAPTTNLQDGSLWIDSDSTDIDVYELQGSPSEWVDTTLNLKGPRGMTFRGTFVDGTTYVADDAVQYNGVLYIATGTTGGSPTEYPNESPGVWDVLLNTNLLVESVVVSGARDITTADKGKALRCTAVLTLSPDPIATLGVGFFCYISATTGIVTVDPDGAELIDGSATKAIADDTGVFMWVEAGGIYTLPMGGGAAGGSGDPLDPGHLFMVASY